MLSIVALSLVAISGCASAEPSSTLADAKSLVQLVRNEAGSRLSADTVADVTLVDDGSAACALEKDDPDGLERRWESTSVVSFVAGAGDSLEATYAELINSFSANGWSEVAYGGGGMVTLQKPDSDASLQFVAEAEDAAAATPASITVVISSGCVQTAGADSDEVVALEKATS